MSGPIKNAFMLISMPILGATLAQRYFAILMKISIIYLKKLCIRIVRYLEETCLITVSQKELLIAWNKLILLRQNLRFSIKPQKGILKPTKAFKSLGELLDSQNIILGLFKEDMKNMKHQFQEIQEESLETVWELGKFIGCLSSKCQTPIQYRTL